jgi:hypothetical protein
MAHQLARKYAQEDAPRSGAFPGHFEGVKAGGFERPPSVVLRACILAHPVFCAALRAPPSFPLTPSQP